MFAQVAAAVAVVFLGYAYRALKPPPPKICGSPGGPPVTSPRIKLSDGRHLAYREVGTSKEEAKYKVIVIHGFDSSKDVPLPIPQELLEVHKIYLLFFDRAGYGESDPNPKRSVKSEVFDIRELADALEIGSRFHLIGLSMGAYPAWSCLKYIRERLAGVSLVSPFVNYWWPCFPSYLSRVNLRRLPVRDQWVFRVAHYASWLSYWWMSQNWFPSLSIMTGNMSIFSHRDLEILKSLSEVPASGQEKIRQQGAFESLHRDVMVGFGKWEFDPLDLNDPFPRNEGSVHIWQGYEDKIVPFQLNRFISERLQWIQYHEIPDGGRLIVFDADVLQSILKALLLS